MKVEQEIEMVKIGPAAETDTLREHPKNPNRGREDLIAESIEVNGWHGVVVAQRSTGYILAGNHRYRVALTKGATEIPVAWRDVDDETALRILLADNQTARKAEMDHEALQEILDGLESLDGTGYGLGDLQEESEAENGHEEASGGQDENDAEGDVPDDNYKPQWAVLVVCDSDEDQQEKFELLQETHREWELKLVAI